MEQISKLVKFAAPFGQEIELLQIVFNEGLPLLRVRIRERSRFTIFEIDAATAVQWARAMLEWADQQSGAETE